MTLEDNPVLTVPLPSNQCVQRALTAGTTAVSLESDSSSAKSVHSIGSSSSSSDASASPEVPVAVAAAVTQVEPTAVDAAIALEQKRAALRAATAQMEQLD